MNEAKPRTDYLKDFPFWKRGMLRLRLKLRRFLIRLQYQMINRIDFGDDELILMNYGFAYPERAQEPELAPEDEPNRLAIQLYDYLLRKTGIAGKDVLEIGCGRGGGAAYAACYFKPASYLGVDFSPGAVAYCKARHRHPGLRFQQGDAENLPLEDASFDVVLNVESSHCYNYVRAFLDEVGRVLRPGGYLLLADFRSEMNQPILRQHLERCPLDIIQDEDISAQVLASLDRDSERKRQLVEAHVPERQRAHFAQFAALKGSKLYGQFANGEVKYFAFVLQKPR